MTTIIEKEVLAKSNRVHTNTLPFSFIGYCFGGIIDSSTSPLPDFFNRPAFFSSASIASRIPFINFPLPAVLKSFAISIDSFIDTFEECLDKVIPYIDGHFNAAARLSYLSR